MTGGISCRTSLEKKNRWQQEHKEIDQYWREVFDTCTEGICIFDLDGRLYDMNEAYCQIVGRSYDELLAMGWLELTVPEYRNEDNKRLPEIMAGKLVRFEKAYQHKDGHPVPILISYKLLKRRPDWDNDRLVATCVNLTNLAVLKQKEQELQDILQSQEVAIAAIGARLSDLAHGDLLAGAPTALSGKLQVLGNDLELLIVMLRDVVTRIQSAAYHMHGGLRDLEAGNQGLDERTQRQAANMEQLSAAIEELSHSVQESAGHASGSAAKSLMVRLHAQQGASLIYSAEEKMRAIATMSHTMAEAISMVDEIAFTTNLLALNAAVEAARAGEHGRSFAIVAQEVRRLALSAARNAKNIKDLVKKSAQIVDEGSALSSQGAEAFGEIQRGIEEVSNRTDDMAHAVEKQQRATSQLADIIRMIHAMTQENRILVAQTSDTRVSLTTQAEQLATLAQYFRTA